jgi:hypothetical protein
MRDFRSLFVAVVTLLVLGVAINAQSSSEGLSCLVNPTNDPSGNSPPGTCAQSTTPITFDICYSACSCTADNTVSCSCLDTSCTDEALLNVCAGIWGCMCVPPCICPNTGEPCSTGCGLGLGQGSNKRAEVADQTIVQARDAKDSPPTQGESDGGQYVLYCSPPPLSTGPTTCGSLNVTEVVCEAYIQDPSCTCTTTGSLNCTAGASAEGCSDEELTTICATNWGCTCEYDASCFCDPPENTIPCNEFGCGDGPGHGWK